MSPVSFRTERVKVLCACLLACILSWMPGAGSAFAQSAAQPDPLSATIKRIQDLTARLPLAVRAKVAAGALLRLPLEWDQVEPIFHLNRVGGAFQPRPFSPSSAMSPSGQVSDPGTDAGLSRMTGSTQSETSTAWCGRRVVVAYNDSGSVLETIFNPGGLSFNGYSLSTDRGRSFTDLGYLNPGPDFNDVLAGDPVVACTDENTFYQSSIFMRNGSLTTDVSVSKSTDGGRTFGDPVSAASQDVFTHILDKPWMAVDPSNPNNIYVTYTDFNVFSPGCFDPFFGSFGISIELVKSSNGGASFGPPIQIDSACFPNGVQGSNVAVDASGNVYVAWERFPATEPTNEIVIAKSTDYGNTFGTGVVAGKVTPVGNPAYGILQGGFRNNEFPSLAIDRSRGPARSAVYVTWNDGRFRHVDDLFFPGTYNFGDIVVARSLDGGATWSAPVKVDDNTGAVASPGTDHYLPGIAVDRNGSVGVCFYDRRRDSANFLIDRECATSANGGRTWTNTRITRTSFAPVFDGDLLLVRAYMGDYDGTAADFLGQSSGFLGAYGDNSRGNPDVKISPRFGPGFEDEDDNTSFQSREQESERSVSR